MLEAKCTRTNCGETFVLQGIMYADRIHGVKADGSECGGIGILKGQWNVPGVTGLSSEELNAELTAQEKHGIEEPDCTRLDCEFHYPDESYTDRD